MKLSFRAQRGICCCVLAGLLVATAFAQTREVAITFDDLPKAVVDPILPGGDINDLRATTWLLLTQLAEHQAPAIGFVNESKLYVNGQLEDRIQLLQMWLDAGQQLGNHGYAHLNFQDTPLARYEDNVIRGETITYWLTKGKEPRYFRHPYNAVGATPDIRDAFRAFLRERGYAVAPFTIEDSDYLFNEVYVRAQHTGDYALVQRIRAAYLDYLDTMFSYFEGVSQEEFGRDIRQIFLIHANDINADMLSDILTRLEKRGYRFITSQRALEDPAYRTPDQYAGPYGISWLHRWKPALGLPFKYTDEPDPPKWILDLHAQGGKTKN